MNVLRALLVVIGVGATLAALAAIVLGHCDGTPRQSLLDDEEKSSDPGTKVSAAPLLSGMVRIEGGNADGGGIDRRGVEIGTPRAALDALLAGRPENHRKLFRHETPRHAVKLPTYWMGRYEVSNAQYLVFLRDHVVTYDTSEGGLANLDDITAHLTGMGANEQKHPKQRVWKQLYVANKDVIWAAFGDRLAALEVKRPGGAVDEEATAIKFRFEPLPRTLQLRFYSLIPPRNWPSIEPTSDELDHPVRFIAYNDAERFAEWAGAHLPTEQEWEWAARGPKGPTFPWGEEWPPTAKYANWCGKIVDERYDPTTLPVDALPAGRSWCGCHHMTGNVTEWTSSWFQPYPGSDHTHSYQGRYVKVLRGGGGGDCEMLVLRPACRNFVGAGPGAPPDPENAFEWAGFRLAAYEQPGRDAIGPILRRATAEHRAKSEHFDLGRIAAAATRNWTDHATPQDHVYARGRAHAVVLLPLRRLLWEQGMAGNAWRKPQALRTLAGLVQRSRTARPKWVLGALHTDLPLAAVEVRAAADGTGRRRRGRPRAPETEAGACAAGTYLLAIWWNRLALLDANRDFVCFLPEPGTGFTMVQTPTDAPARLRLHPHEDRADFVFDLPVGGRGRSDELRLRVTARLAFPRAALESAGTWHHSAP